MATIDQTTSGAPAEAEQADQQAGELGIELSDSPFTLELSEDQRDIREWVHGFAEQTVRPAAQQSAVLMTMETAVPGRIVFSNGSDRSSQYS